MAKQTITAHLCMALNFPLQANGRRDYLQEQVWEPEVWGFRMKDERDRIYIGPQQLTVEVPDNFNPVPAQVAALEQEKREAMDAYQKRVAEINERLSKLLAITHEA